MMKRDYILRIIAVLFSVLTTVSLIACGEELVFRSGCPLGESDSGEDKGSSEEDPVSQTTITRVSVDSNGNNGNNHSSRPSISADGRYVAFSSYATNLVPNDTNGKYDIFVHDRQSGETTRVSVDSDGNEANSGSYSPSISADGRYVAFMSYATNLVPNDTNDEFDLFVHDRQSGETTRVSVDSNGNEADDWSRDSSISADGRYVAFESWGTNLVPNDTNNNPDIFVHDRLNGLTTRVSVDSNGIEGNGPSYHPSISADGRYIAFTSDASNLVPNDTNDDFDIFVHDRQSRTTTRVAVESLSFPSISADGRYVAFESLRSLWDANLEKYIFVDNIFVRDRQSGSTTRVSVNSNGNEANDRSSSPSISADGRYVAFTSRATNLVPNDNNGYSDVFIHDRLNGLTTRVSVDYNGDGGNYESSRPEISADGRYVAFSSISSNFVVNDTNAFTDIFTAPVP